MIGWALVYDVKLGVKRITREVYDSETLDDAILNIPDEADVVYNLPDSLVGTRLTDLMTGATKRNVPTSIPNISKVKKCDGLTLFWL